jgi:glycosyltransferase involved in cell wall biosynthesis
MTPPKISIVTPSFNQGPFLEKTIRSVLDQDYPNLEYIIIDGGSTDNSVDIIKKYEAKLAFWVSEKDKGQSDALNKGFAKVTGEIIGWVNSDDWYEPDTFRTIAALFQKKNLSAVVGNCAVWYAGDPSKNYLVKPGRVTFESLSRFWKPAFCPPQPAIFFSKAALKKSGTIDVSLNYGMDLDLWLRIAQNGTFHYVDQTFANYLIHDSSKSGSDSGFLKFRKEWREIVFRNLTNASLFQKMLFYRDYIIHFHLKKRFK